MNLDPMNIDQINQAVEFFQWMTIINVGIFLVAVVAMIALKNIMSHAHGILFNINEEKIPQIQYAWLGAYKIFIIIFNVVPLIALNMIK